MCQRSRPPGIDSAKWPRASRSNANNLPRTRSYQQKARTSRPAGKKRGEAKYDPLRAQLYVLKGNGMANPDLTLNRKGKLFLALTTREEAEEAA